MTYRLAINGFGRIGRSVLRAWAKRSALGDMTLVAINEIADAETVAHLARYDSTHGRFPGQIELDHNGLRVNQHSLRLLQESDIVSLPWAEEGIDLVLECTGAFSDRRTAEQHLQAGGRRVLLSQPAQPDVDDTIVWGLNQSVLTAQRRVVSAASCTTNALCPVLFILDRIVGIQAGTVTTVHSAMNDQPVLDAYHHTDLRKTRAAFQSIIPVDTELAIGVPRILPQLEGKLTAHALRVPTLNVSAMDITIQTQSPCNRQQINDALRLAATTELKGILDVTDEPLASCDFNGELCSAVVDASQTQVAGHHLLKVLVWFDNEWAYANRLLDIAAHFKQLDEFSDPAF